MRRRPIPRASARRWPLLAALSLAATLPAATAAPATAATNGEAQAAASTVSAAAAIGSGWTGSTSTCTVGTESPASVDATLRAVNAFRAVAGLGPVTLDPTMSQQALAAALMMRAGNEQGNALGLSHSPDSTWPCWSSEGSAAAGRSNLALGASGASAIRLYVADEGVAGLGHRRWILDPGATVFGTGSTGSTNALQVIGGARAAVPSGAQVAWPPAGAIASSWVPSTWSLSVGGTGDSTAFIAPQVSMSLDGTPLPVGSMTDLGTGYGTGRALGWTPSLDRSRLSSGYHELSVAISGITVNGAAVPVNYTTTIGAAPAAPAPAPAPAPVAIAAAPTPSSAGEPAHLEPRIVHRRGKVRRGMRLTARFAQGTGRIVTRFQWLRGGRPIKGANAVRYHVRRADRGHSLRVRITSQVRSGHWQLTERSAAIRVPRR